MVMSTKGLMAMSFTILLALILATTTLSTPAHAQLRNGTWTVSVCTFGANSNCTTEQICETTTSGGCVEVPLPDTQPIKSARVYCVNDTELNVNTSFYDEDGCVGNLEGTEIVESGTCANAEGAFDYILTCTYVEITPSPTPSATPTPTSTATPSSTPSPSPSPSPNSDDVCFPADAMVELENGVRKRMDKVEIGDRVRVSNDQYSDVYFFGHRKRLGHFDFVQISLGKNKQITMSDGHLVMANQKWTRAVDVAIGDLLLDVEKNEYLPVVSVDKVRKAGLFNPHTLHGEIVVNSIQASSYTDILHPKLAHLLLLPERLAYMFRRGVSIYGSMLEQATPTWLSFWPRSQMARYVFEST